MANIQKIIQIAISSPRDARQYGPAHDTEGTPYKSELIFALTEDGKIFYRELQEGIPSMNQDAWVALPGIAEDDSLSG